MLLVDIKMPKNCYGCPFIDKDIRIGDSCALTTPGKECENYSHSRPDWCPLIEVDKPTQCVNDWILVSERLPDEPYNVLTCDKYGNIHIMRHQNGYSHPFGIRPNNSRYYPVYAWMPLPEPPTVT